MCSIYAENSLLYNMASRTVCSQPVQLNRPQLQYFARFFYALGSADTAATSFTKVYNLRLLLHIFSFFSLRDFTPFC